MSRRFTRPYAQALLSSAGNDVEAQSVRAELALYAEAAQQIPALDRMAASPAIPIEVKETILAEVCKKLEIGNLGHSLLALLMRNFRLIHLGAVLEAIDQILNRRLGVVVAEVTSAHPLGDEQRDRLQNVLAGILDQSVDLTLKTDPKLLGGFVARIGSYRYDASLEGQLGRLAGALGQEQ
jgi:F-type H+-transporting ATPase subunit delta